MTEELAPLTLASPRLARFAKGEQCETTAYVRTRTNPLGLAAARCDLGRANARGGREAKARSETLGCIAKRARRGKESQFLLRVSLCAHRNREESGCKMSRSRRPRFQVLATD